MKKCNFTKKAVRDILFSDCLVSFDYHNTITPSDAYEALRFVYAPFWPFSQPL